MPRVDEYNARLDAVLCRDNLPDFVAFAAEQCVRFSCEHAAEIAMHKARTARPGLPQELRSSSKTWLQAQGYEPWDDGDVAGLCE